MIRSLVIVVIGCAVGGIIIAQDAVPWPVTPEKLISGRAPLAIGGEWEGRLVRLEGAALKEERGELNGQQGVFTQVAHDGAVLVFREEAVLVGSTEPPPIRLVGRVTRAPEEIVTRFGEIKFPGRICVDATAPRVTWRFFVGLAVILWGFYIMIRGVKREQAKRREEAAPVVENPVE